MDLCRTLLTIVYLFCCLKYFAKHDVHQRFE